MTVHLNQPVRIGDTVWLGYVAAIDRSFDDVLVIYPLGQHHDGGRAAYKLDQLALNNDGELVAPYGEVIR
jgi:hypothetical protein